MLVDLEVPLTSRDEDVSGVKRAKVRNPKSRDKWSLLWFIPPSVLNDREVSFDGRKGKRLGFDRFNDLCCKTCHRSFHNSEVLSIHRSETHKNTSMLQATLLIHPQDQDYPQVTLLPQDHH